MENWPDITVLVATYNRLEILATTLIELNHHLNYAGVIRYLICDDSEDFVPVAVLVARQVFSDRIRFVHTTGRQGLGANVNNGLKHLETEIVLQTQDDYQPVKTVELNAHVQRLLTNSRPAWIRLRHIVNHRFHARLEGEYWQVDLTGSPELYIFSDQPHIKLKGVHESLGMYPEGLKVGETENAWCNQANHAMLRDSAPIDYLIPVKADLEGTWAHVANGPELSWKDRGL